MSTATIAVRRYHVRNKRYTVRSFFLALLLHAGLVAWMWYAVQWHTSPAAPAVAELWEPTPQVTPPTPEPQPQPQPTPPPPAPTVEQSPPKPDIVQQKEKPKKKEPESKVEPPPKRENTPKKPTAAELKKQQAEAQKRFEDEMKRLSNTADSAPAPRASQAYSSSGGADNSWVGKVVGAVKSHLNFAVPEGVTPDVYAEFQVALLPTGELAGDPILTKSSGVPGYDDAALRAILRTNPFPRRDDGTVPRSLTLDLHPQDTR